MVYYDQYKLGFRDLPQIQPVFWWNSNVTLFLSEAEVGMYAEPVWWVRYTTKQGLTDSAVCTHGKLQSLLDSYFPPWGRQQER